MTPGLAFFYGGMVRSKNVLGMLMQNVFAMGLVSTLWAIVGFSLVFGETDNLWIGNFDFVFLENVPRLDGDIPGMAFVAFQMMFAVITLALITGATADRLKFGSYAIFIGLWSLLVYVPVAKCVFNGWLLDLGALDFAGGAAIHINAGVAAIAVVIVRQPDRSRIRADAATQPAVHDARHRDPVVRLDGLQRRVGAGRRRVAAQAVVNTQLGAAAGMLGWLLVEKIKSGKATTLGAAFGAVTGLVAITPCAGFVGGASPLIIGAIAGIICYLALGIKEKMNWDDSLTN